MFENHSFGYTIVTNTKMRYPHISSNVSAAGAFRLRFGDVSEATIEHGPVAIKFILVESGCMIEMSRIGTLNPLIQIVAGFPPIMFGRLEEYEWRYCDLYYIKKMSAKLVNADELSWCILHLAQLI